MTVTTESSAAEARKFSTDLAVKQFLRALTRLVDWPVRRLLAIQAVRRRVIFEVRQRHYNDLECRLPIGRGLECPVQFWEAWASFGHIFFGDEYARAFDVMPPPERWIDLGCYAGYFSLYTAWQRARRGLAGSGYALLIDADSRAFHAVEEVVRLNRLASRWFFLRRAIAREPGLQRFAERAFMTSSLAGNDDRTNVTEAEVITDTQIVEAFAPPYDLVKVDIEGAEHDFLLAYGEVLSHTEFLLVEWHAWHAGGGGEAQIRALAEERGFQFVCEVLAPSETEHRREARNSGVHLYRRVH